MKYDQLHKTNENHRLEFKESFGRETIETVVAFCNASGNLMGGLKPEDLIKGDYIAMHRNKLLAEAFYLRGDIEKFGTGFFRIQSELKDSPEVSFNLESLNGFTRSELKITAQVTAQDGLGDIQDTHQDTPQDNALVNNTIGYDGLGDKMGDVQDTHQDTAQDTAQVTAQDGLGDIQDTHQDTHQDTAQVQDLIMNFDGEMTREEILKKLGLTHREYFRKFYLKPALESGLIEMTIPAKPNSKYQKYRLTEKGKRIKMKKN